MTTTAISPRTRGERRYRAYQRRVHREGANRRFRDGLRVAFFGIMIGVIVGLIVAAWDFPTWL